MKLIDEACRVIRDQFHRFEGSLDHLFLGGDRIALKVLENRCDYLQRFTKIRSKRILQVPNPKQTVLEGLPKQIYSSTVLTISYTREQDV